MVTLEEELHSRSQPGKVVRTARKKTHTFAVLMSQCFIYIYILKTTLAVTKVVDSDTVERLIPERLPCKRTFYNP